MLIFVTINCSFLLLVNVCCCCCFCYWLATVFCLKILFPAYIPFSNITSKLLRFSCPSIPLHTPPFRSAQSKMLNTCVGRHRVIVYLLSFFLSGRKWLMYVRSIYLIWQRDTVHLNWLSILGMALSIWSNMKMNLMLSLQTHQILLVCIIIIIIIVIVVFVIPQFGSRKRACIWPNQYCSVLLQVLHFLLGFSQSDNPRPAMSKTSLDFLWILGFLWRQSKCEESALSRLHILADLLGNRSTFVIVIQIFRSVLRVSMFLAFELKSSVAWFWKTVSFTFIALSFFIFFYIMKHGKFRLFL